MAISLYRETVNHLRKRTAHLSKVLARGGTLGAYGVDPHTGEEKDSGMSNLMGQDMVRYMSWVLSSMQKAHVIDLTEMNGDLSAKVADVEFRSRIYEIDGAKTPFEFTFLEMPADTWRKDIVAQTAVGNKVGMLVWRTTFQEVLNLLRSIDTSKACERIIDFQLNMQDSDFLPEDDVLMSVSILPIRVFTPSSMMHEDHYNPSSTCTHIYNISHSMRYSSYLNEEEGSPLKAFLLDESKNSADPNGEINLRTCLMLMADALFPYAIPFRIEEEFLRSRIDTGDDGMFHNTILLPVSPMYCTQRGMVDSSILKELEEAAVKGAPIEDLVQTGQGVVSNSVSFLVRNWYARARLLEAEVSKEWISEMLENSGEGFSEKQIESFSEILHEYIHSDYHKHPYPLNSIAGIVLTSDNLKATLRGDTNEEFEDTIKDMVCDGIRNTVTKNYPTYIDLYTFNDDKYRFFTDREIEGLQLQTFLHLYMNQEVELVFVNNHRTLRKRKVPLRSEKYRTHTLVIKKTKERVVSQKILSQIERAKSRAHWRRGHYRKLKSGASVFVRECRVNDENAELLQPQFYRMEQ